MRADYLAYGLGRRRVVEQNVTAAIDLNVDKAGRQPASVRQFVQWHTWSDFGARKDAADTCAVDDYSRVAMQSFAIEHAACRDRVRLPALCAAHRVRVTFCRCRG